MAHGENAEKHGHRLQQKEYWASRLHRHGERTGKSTKVLTHRKERRIGRKYLRDAG